MGVAIANAHLFDETQRLLKETEDRAKELAILNSVGEAMAKTLNVKTVTRIVGDKVREIFGAEVTEILLRDACVRPDPRPLCVFQALSGRRAISDGRRTDLQSHLVRRTAGPQLNRTSN